MSGPLIDGYHSFVRIGKGGLGDVYRAVHASSGRTVAVKVLRDVSDASIAWHRTRRELAALVALRGHPNVIESIDLVELESGPALVMEYAAGGSLAELMRSRERDTTGSLSAAETLLVARQTANALLAAHERGIVHRDVKPQNLLIDAGGQVKLCDFGIAALTHDDEYRTRTNAVSTRYASPEDLEADAAVGPPTDIYSLGATMLHALHGAPPSLRERIGGWTPPPGEDGSSAIDEVIAACLRPDPSDRPTAVELVARLDALAAAGVVPAIERLGGAAARPVPLIRFDEEPRFDRDATTVRRPSRWPDRDESPEPAASHGVPRPSRRNALGTRRLIGVAAASLLALVAFGVVAVRWRSDEASASAPPVVPRPAGLVPLTTIDWSAGSPGDCLRQEPDADSLDVVTCTESHDLQRFASGELPDELASDAIDESVAERCDAAFAVFVGAPATRSRLDIAVTRPTQQSWQSGDRAFQCYLGIEGKRLTADAQSTGW